MYHWSWVLVPVVIGLCQPVIWQMTLRLAKTAGDMPAAAMMHLVGAVAGGVFVIAGLQGGDANWHKLPWWVWFGGAIGVSCLWLLNMTVPRVGIATVMAILVASQLMASLIFEGYGLMGTATRPIQWFHWLGVLMLAGGAYLVSRS